ncbi:MAG TPA: BTAD domain-containing putative transcriptional regulator, partial [Oscillatoriaceae cyanobacterium]
LQARMRELRALLQRHGYDFVLERPTLLGFETAEAMRNFREQAIAHGVPEPLFTAEAPTRAESLRIRTLGAFRVTRGQTPLSDRDFGREKARQLLHVLAAHSGEWLPKTRLIDLLWPEADPDSADGTFRVALNALQKALEPDRPSGKPGRYVLKQGTSYRLSEDAWLDAREFERLLAAADAFEDEAAIPLYREALTLCEGPFLAEFPQYDAWCDRERERLAALYREGACRLARLLVDRGDAEAASWAERVLEREPCAEEAARALMTAQAHAGDRAQAIRTYDRLVVALDEELDVDPMPETQQLYERLVNLDGGAVTSL